jgi:hypothetical protein
MFLMVDGIVIYPEEKHMLGGSAKQLLGSVVEKDGHLNNINEAILSGDIYYDFY